MSTKQSSKEYLTHENVVGLDLATKAGIAIYTPDQQTVLQIVSKCPIAQLNEILELTKENNCLFVIEQLTYFRNAKVIKSLSERIGYIYYSLNSLERHKALQINVNRVRGYLGTKNKKETLTELSRYVRRKRGVPSIQDNHTDAISLVLYVLKKQGKSIQNITFQMEKDIKV